MKGTKISDLARITYLGQGDGITGTGIMDATLLGTGEQVTWRPNGSDWEYIVGHIAPIHVGDEIAIEAFSYGGTLKRVRYSCRGRSFRGMAAHRPTKR